MGSWKPEITGVGKSVYTLHVHCCTPYNWEAQKQGQLPIVYFLKLKPDWLEAQRLPAVTHNPLNSPQFAIYENEMWIWRVAIQSLVYACCKLAQWFQKLFSLAFHHHLPPVHHLLGGCELAKPANKDLTCKKDFKILLTSSTFTTLSVHCKTSHRN